MHEFDVIICGAGPAGTTCALALFDAGLSVALIDKEIFPRDKVCGDAYGGYAYKILNTISPEFGKKLISIKQGNPSTSVMLYSQKGKKYKIKLNGFFANLPRKIFDNFLLQMVKDETETKVFENTILQNISVTKDRVIATTSTGEIFSSKIIVGCDGAQSLVRSVLTKTRQQVTDVCPGLRGYYKNVKAVSADTLELHFVSQIPKGYLWIFPSIDGLVNVGVASDKSSLLKHKINLRKEFDNLLHNSSQFKERFADAELVGEIKGWAIPVGYFSSTLPISGDRVLLCGDAAALVDPATGEGIAPAMSSGRFAGKFIKHCFEENNFSAAFMKKYDQQIHGKYYRDYKLRSIITELVSRFPSLLGIIISIAKKIFKIE